jgi:hypothetical protein
VIGFIVDLPGNTDAEHLHGAGRIAARADARRSGQLFGTQIPHALLPTPSVLALMIAVISSAFRALSMATPRLGQDAPPRSSSARVRAIDLPPVAPTANVKQAVAKATSDQSMIVQAPAPSDNFLPSSHGLRQGRPTSARPRNKEGRELSLPAFCILSSA